MNAKYSRFDDYALQFLISHLVKSSRKNKLFEILTDIEYLELKCKSKFSYSLINDYELAIRIFDTKINEEADKKEELQFFESFIKKHIRHFENNNSIDLILNQLFYHYLSRANEIKDNFSFISNVYNIVKKRKIPWLQSLYVTPELSTIILAEMKSDINIIKTHRNLGFLHTKEGDIMGFRLATGQKMWQKRWLAPFMTNRVDHYGQTAISDRYHQELKPIKSNTHKTEIILFEGNEKALALLIAVEQKLLDTEHTQIIRFSVVELESGIQVFENHTGGEWDWRYKSTEISPDKKLVIIKGIKVTYDSFSGTYIHENAPVMLRLFDSFSGEKVDKKRIEDKKQFKDKNYIYCFKQASKIVVFDALKRKEIVQINNPKAETVISQFFDNELFIVLLSSNRLISICLKKNEIIDDYNFPVNPEKWIISFHKLIYTSENQLYIYDILNREIIYRLKVEKNVDLQVVGQDLINLKTQKHEFQILNVSSGNIVFLLPKSTPEQKQNIHQFYMHKDNSLHVISKKKNKIESSEATDYFYRSNKNESQVMTKLQDIHQIMLVKKSNELCIVTKNEILLWDISKSEIEKSTFCDLTSKVIYSTVAQVSSTVAYISESGEVSLINRDKTKRILPSNIISKPQECAFTDNDTKLIVSNAHSVALFDIMGDKFIFQKTFIQNITKQAIYNAGKLIVITGKGGFNSFIHVYNIRLNICVRSIQVDREIKDFDYKNNILFTEDEKKLFIWNISYPNLIFGKLATVCTRLLSEIMGINISSSDGEIKYQLPFGELHEGVLSKKGSFLIGKKRETLHICRLKEFKDQFVRSFLKRSISYNDEELTSIKNFESFRFSDDEKAIVFYSKFGQISRYQLETKQLSSVFCSNQIDNCEIDFKAEHIAAISNKELYIFNYINALQ